MNIYGNYTLLYMLLSIYKPTQLEIGYQPSFENDLKILSFPAALSVCAGSVKVLEQYFYSALVAHCLSKIYKKKVGRIFHVFVSMILAALFSVCERLRALQHHGNELSRP